MTSEHDVNIGFKRRPPKRHPVLDCFMLLFAAGLIGTIFHSGAVFAFCGAALVGIYVLGNSSASAKGGT